MKLTEAIQIPVLEAPLPPDWDKEKFSPRISYKAMVSYAHGKMMQTGYIGKDSRVRNHKMPDYTGHAFYEHDNVVEMIVNVIKKG